MISNDKVIEEFRANGGRVGGVFAERSLLLLHTIGARSGQSRVHPLVYIADGDRFIVAASKGGADSHPAWFHNLQAHPEVTVEVGTETLRARAVVTDAAERTGLYARLAERYSFFSDYAANTSRVIPVVALEPLG